MPGIKPLLGGLNESSGKNKLADFANEYWYYDNITKKSEKQFIASYKVGKKEWIPPEPRQSSKNLSPG